MSLRSLVLLQHHLDVSKGTIWIISLILPHVVVTNLASHSVVMCKQRPLYCITYKIYINQNYASITIVQNYTGNITTFVAICIVPSVHHE